MTPTDLVALVRDATTRVLAGRGLGALTVEVDVARPRHPGHGDYATSVAPRVARRVDVPARELVRHLRALTDAFHRFDAARRILPMGDEPTTSEHRDPAPERM